MTKEQFDLAYKLLNLVVKFAKEEAYSDFIQKAVKISPDPNDADFFALALKLNCPLWSEDKLLQKQNKIKIYNTTELLRLTEQFFG